MSHVVLSGPRRTGKTSVCGAVCANLRDKHDFLVIELETSEQSSAEGLCQLMIDRCSRLDLDQITKGLLRKAVPTVQKLLDENAIPLDLSGFGAEIPDATRRAALSLPAAIAERQQQKVVLFIDELQRAVNYADGVGLIHDLLDIYCGQSNVVLLIDGSDERTIETLMRSPFDLARLGQRIELSPTIPADQWRAPLRSRFQRAQLDIDEDSLEQIIAFGEDKPYDTMAACLYVGLNARRTESETVDDFVLQRGLGEARARLEEDG
jgi:AAA+ ATPase superfamily predicted ATPase